MDKILEPRYIENDLRNKGEVEHYCTFCKRNTTFRFRELPPNKDNPLSTYYLPLGRDEAEKWWKCDECNSWRETIVDISIKQLLKGVILRFK